ncbi:ParB/RepB/Spo0J family partition protein [Cupriavidus nantongensis]|uniref:Chromosome partitioning protein ParB n=1 Tax=Cupriavidus nantongensis TaxID=1796606 RepID=A0A142JMI2_9BURK|nr:hypothetical protein [Cupriavidus nantongensis]AMR79294.1 hypothetical protein A2G96_16995 [Cupriavidus nantongensis]
MSHKPGDLLHIRARDLILSPRNQRTRLRKRVLEIGASLVSHGQIENLSVIPHVSRKKNAPAFEVIDGGTRLEAAMLKISAGELPESFEFLCMVADPDHAEEISVAANMHEPMHPADEFDAFKGMIDAGKSIEDVAARFGVTPLTVQRRLKLANVSPHLVQGYRDGELTLDQLMAFAISDSHKAQESLWKRLTGASPWEKTADKIRAALATPGAINAKTDRLARFVGLDVYEAAGGKVMRDLFSDGGGFVSDSGLLQRLAEEKLAAAAEDVRAEGWSWVKTVDKWTYSDEMAYSKSQPKKRDLTDEECGLLASLREREAALDKKTDALDFEDEELDAELDDVRGQIEAMEALQSEFSDRQKSKGGAVLTIDHGGQLKIVRGLIAPTERKAKKDIAGDTSSERLDKSAAPAEESERPLSERLVTQLTAHRTAALQALIAQSPRIALVSLLHALVPQVFMPPEDRYRYSAAAKVSLTNNRGLGRDASGDLESSRAWLSLDQSIGHWQAVLPGEDEDLFAWLQNLSPTKQLELLAVCVAHSINTVELSEVAAGHARAHQLAAAVGLDMADWWEPTGASYLASVPKSRRMDAVREVAGDEAAERIGTMKKDAMIGAAEEYLAGRRWLPHILRQPGAPATDGKLPTTAEAEA